MIEVDVLFLVIALFKVFVQSTEVPRTSVVFLDSFLDHDTVRDGITKSVFNDFPPVEKKV